MSGSTPETGGYVAPNFPNPQGPDDAHIIIYGYIPSFALCILAIVLYTIAFFVHLYEVARYKTWYFLPLSLGCALEILGYIFRALSAHKDPYNIIDFVIQYFMIVTAPVFISASIYVCLSRLITWATTEGLDLTRSRGAARWIKPKGILWGFISCDVVSTVIQIAGAALIGKKESDHKDATIPNNILLAGLAFQTFAFTVFLILLGLFRWTLQKQDKGTASHSKDTFIAALAGSSLLIYLRTSFRLAETSQGVFGYLSTHEVFFGVLEFAPVIVAVWILAVWHPARSLPQRNLPTGHVEEHAEGQKW
jgi:hypothetical protein